MDNLHQVNIDLQPGFYFERSRLNNLFMRAVDRPLVLVCAGAGYGKTSAVIDFTQMYQANTAWMRLSERDNTAARFWENFIHSIEKLTESFARVIRKINFPDTREKLNSYQILVRKYIDDKRRIFVIDDFHYITNPSVSRFLEFCANNMPPGLTMFIISRSTPDINIASMVSKNLIYTINEDELRFTDAELSQYFRQMDIPLPPDSIREIMQDTGGWTFAINLIVRSYRKAPGYDGYLRNAMKSNIFDVMETEIWEGISKHLQKFLVCLSLIGHLSVDLIGLLAKGDEKLIAELEQQNAYIRRDNNINVYLIHPLLLEFLATKQMFISDGQKKETYAIAGEWCDRNGFKIDALSYYEKTGNYEKIVSLIYDLPYQIPYDIAKFTGEILERAPAGEFIEVNALAAAHIRVLMGQGRWQEAIDLAGYYEKKFIKMTGDSVFKRVSLGCIYYCWGMARIALCVTEDRYDFNIQFKKFIDYISGLDIHSDFPHKIPHRIPPPWIVFTGSSRKGAPEECISALANTVTLMTQHFDGRMAGEDDLAWGELKFYQGDIHDAELSVIRALERAREFKQHEIIHRALFYFMRIAIVRGNYEQAAQALKDMETNLNDDTYTYRFINYDISLCWYYCALFMPEKTPDWLKENFSPYAHAIFIENYANQAKARYCYQSRNYAPLLSYIQEMRQRESFLFGRAEMFAIEACIYYKTGDRKKAYGVLEEAWKTASPNNIVIPFIELGKDMRTLTASLLKENTGGIPAEWLENINKKSSSYAKQLAHVIAEYNQVNGAEDSVDITPRELEVLEDLSHGLTRAEIAASHGLSINTVKMVISNLYTKMGAKNLPDVIHIATERKII